jgi:hypothetical protein
LAESVAFVAADCNAALSRSFPKKELLRSRGQAKMLPSSMRSPNPSSAPCKTDIPASTTPDTTSTQASFLEDEVCPFTGQVVGLLTVQEIHRREEMHEQARLLCEKEYSSSPLWQARVQKNPDYFKTFSPGGVR